MTENTRLIWPDNCKALAMIGVYLVHFGPNKLFFNWIWFVMLPIFFYISGYFFKYRGLKESLLKIISCLILPYICVNLIARLSSIRLLKKIAEGEWGYVLDNFSQILADYDQYWFITSLVSIQLCVLLIFYLIKSERIRSIILICLACFCIIFPLFSDGVILPFCLSATIIGLGFFLIGYLRRDYEIFIAKIPTLFICVLFVMYFLIGLFVTYKYDAFVDVHLNLYNPLWVTWAISLFGSFIFIEFIKRLNIKNKVLSFIGQNTLILFLYCGLTTHFLTKILSLSFNPTINGIIYSTLLLVINLLIAYMANRFFPILSGKKKL